MSQLKNLVFGDTDQIAYVRKMEKVVELYELPNCKECFGTGKNGSGCDCWGCTGNIETDCELCDGIGKDQKSYENFVQNHGPFTFWTDLEKYREERGGE